MAIRMFRLSSKTWKKMEKGNDEFELMDRIVAAIEKGIEVQNKEKAE